MKPALFDEYPDLEGKVPWVDLGMVEPRCSG